MGHPDAVGLTIANIKKNFVMVGVLEELEKSVEVMECLMPTQMKGLVDIYKKSKIHKYDEEFSENIFCTLAEKESMLICHLL